MIFFATGATVMATHAIYLFMNDRDKLNSSYGPGGPPLVAYADEANQKDNLP